MIAMGSILSFSTPSIVDLEGIPDSWDSADSPLVAGVNMVGDIGDVQYPLSSESRRQIFVLSVRRGTYPAYGEF